MTLSLSTLIVDPDAEVENVFRYYGTGRVFGIIMCVIIIVDYVWLAILEWWEPREKIRLAPKFDLDKWRKVRLPSYLRYSSTRSATDPHGGK